MEKLALKLKQREKEGNLRSLSIKEGLIDFFSNDYLGLAKSKDLANDIHEEFVELSGNLNGSTGSRLLSGNSSYVLKLEEQLAELFNGEKALIFNSGYNANLSILSSVPQKEDTIIYDELIHASLKEGARLSFAQRFSFRHNDIDELEKKIKRASGNVYVIAESVYSMDGDAAPLRELIDCCKRNNAFLILDEAHSTGIYGKGGNGLACNQNLESEIFARIYTFGKAMGVHGACIVGSKILIDYLINFARPFIYTTSLPPHSLIAINQAFGYIKQQPEVQEQIKNKILLFKNQINQYPEIKERLIQSNSPIQVLRVEGNERTRLVAASINQKGFDVRAILAPTVKQGEERLRICLHVYNTQEEITELVEAIGEILQ